MCSTIEQSITDFIDRVNHMFKWTCLLVAVVFLTALTWMINDARLEIRRTADIVNQKLPPLADQSTKTLDTVNDKLPEIVANVHMASEALADLAGDLSQLKEFAGATGVGRDKALVDYADSMLSAVAQSNGTIGVKSPLGGRSLTRTKPASEWTANARKEAALLSILTHSKKEMANRLAKTALGNPWYIQFGTQEAMQLMDWIKANHPESKDL